MSVSPMADAAEAARFVKAGGAAESGSASRNPTGQFRWPCLCRDQLPVAAIMGGSFKSKKPIKYAYSRMMNQYQSGLS